MINIKKLLFSNILIYSYFKKLIGGNTVENNYEFQGPMSFSFGTQLTLFVIILNIKTPTIVVIMFIYNKKYNK